MFSFLAFPPQDVTVPTTTVKQVQNGRLDTGIKMFTDTSAGLINAFGTATSGFLNSFASFFNFKLQ